MPLGSAPLLRVSRHGRRPAIGRPAAVRVACSSRAVLWILLVSCVAVSCSAVHRPPVTLHTKSGVVRADTQALAVDVGDELDLVYPHVRDALVGIRDLPPEVWVVPEIGGAAAARPDTVGGVFLVPDDQIHVRVAWEPPKSFAETAEWAEHSRRLALAHELVHFLLDESWRTLPIVAEEGLCDVLAARTVAPLGPMARGLQGGTALRAFGPVQVTVMFAPAGRQLGPMHAVMLAAPPPTAHLADVFARRRVASDIDALDGDPWEAVHRALGFVVVSRILERGGIEGLHALCVRARDEGLEIVPFPWLAAAAGLPLEGERSEQGPTWADAWAAACLQLMDTATHRWIAMDFIDLAGDAVGNERLRRSLTRQLGRDLDGPDDFLRAVEATLWISLPGLENGIRFLQYPPRRGLAIRLDELPGFDALVRAAWRDDSGAP